MNKVDGKVSIGSAAINGIFWSLLQSWSARILTFVTFVVIARFLTPEQYGLASAAATCLLLISTVSEFGYGDAIIQNRTLEAKDINLPFFASLCATTVFCGLAWIFAEEIATLLKAPGLEKVIGPLCLIAPITTASMFQEAIYKKNFAFKSLALRIIVANLASAPIAIALAYMGAGVWSIVAQTQITVLIGMIWLWRRPYWRPTRSISPGVFWRLTRFGAPIVSMRALDFATMRLVDVIIVLKFGLPALGLYSVGSRLYQTLMQLLQSALNDVSLPILSSISEDRDRMASVYLQAIVIASLFASPVFVLFGSLSSEICAVLFGEKWAGVDRLALPLLLVGSLQCVQFLNGPYLNARGRPGLALAISIIKYASMIVGLLAFSAKDTATTVTLFALMQLVATPFTFYAVAHELGFKATKIIQELFPSAAANLIGFAAVSLCRPMMAPHIHHPIPLGLALGCIFAACFVGIMLILGRRQVALVVDFASRRLNRNK